MSKTAHPIGAQPSKPITDFRDLASEGKPRASIAQTTPKEANDERTSRTV